LSAMDANEEQAPQGVAGKNVAKRRREQQRRALGRKVAWLAGLLQTSAAHHTGTKHSPNTGNLEKETEATLERRLEALEQLMGTLVRWYAGPEEARQGLGGNVAPSDGGGESMRETARSWRPVSKAEAITRRTLAQGSSPDKGDERWLKLLQKVLNAVITLMVLDPAVKQLRERAFGSTLSAKAKWCRWWFR